MAPRELVLGFCPDFLKIDAAVDENDPADDKEHRPREKAPEEIKVFGKNEQSGAAQPHAGQLRILSLKAEIDNGAHKADEQKIE